jgi:hypothetical protein
MANFEFRNSVCAPSFSTMPGHDNAINPSSLPQTSSISTWRAKLEELLHEAVRFSSFVVTLGEFLYFNQGITPPCSLDGSGVHADAILTYVYDTRDVSAGEWIARERRCRRAVSILEFEKYEAMQARKRLERLWALASRIRDLIQESGMTDNIPCITYGRDSPHGSTEIVPIDLTFLNDMGKYKPFFLLIEAYTNESIVDSTVQPLTPAPTHSQ